MEILTRVLFASLLALPMAGPAQAQLTDFLKRVLPAMSTPSTGTESPATTSTADAALANAAPLLATAKVQSEMAPDVNCNRPRERFNVAEKLANYGGTAATLRLQRLLDTDFQYSDLTPEDRELLRYLAQTTVWVPAEAEAKLGAIYDASVSLFGLSFGSQSESDASLMSLIEARLKHIREVVPEYPAEIRLKLDKKLQDGAFARLGGLILLSERFLNGLTDAESGTYFLLAHEVSHVYKRHALKDIQYKLISSAEGWELGKKILQRAQRGMGVDPIGDGVFLFTTVPRLVEFVRSVQIRFGIDQELEADACSTVWLKAMKIDPSDAWNRYQAVLGPNSLYSVEHPSTEERQARFKRKATEPGAIASQKSPDKGTVKKEGQKMLDAAKTKKP